MAAQPIAAPLTSDDFLEIYSQDGEEALRQFELFDGEVTERPMANLIHDEIKNVLCKELDRYFDKRPGHLALVETTFKLGATITFTPDLAVIESGRWKSMRREKFATGSPDIAFEVVSCDRADRLQFKIDAYLEHGSKAVCCVYPSQQKITVYTENRWFEFKGGASLEFPSVLPGFSLALSALFETAE